MGCGGSKQEENPDVIKYEMKPTKIAEFDKLFDEAGGILKNLEEIRASFQDSTARMHEIGRTNELKTPDLKEAFRTFFWSVSAHKAGKISDSGLKFEDNPISLMVNCDNMDHETYEFSQKAKEFVGGATSAPEKVQALYDQLQNLLPKVEGLTGVVKDQGSAANLSLPDITRAIGNTTTNIKTIQSGLPKAKNVSVQVKDGSVIIHQLVPEIKAMINAADEVGKKAADENLLKMSEIFDKYVEAPKKTPQELNAIKPKSAGLKPKPEPKEKKEVAADKKAEEKPAETKPAETKPEETKPEEHKVEEQKPVESQPSENKPEEHAQEKPAEA